MMFDNADYLMLDGAGRPTRLNGPKAKPMLFPYVMCKRCNNTRSQPFDKAYDKFVQKVRDEPEYFRGLEHLTWAEVFPDDPHFGPKKLARYYMKNIACRIAELGFEVPEQIVDFMNGAHGMPNAVLLLYKDFSAYDQFQRAGVDGHYPFANRMHEPESADGGPLTAFCAEVQDGPVGAAFWWTPSKSFGTNFCSQGVVPLRERHELPHHELHQTEWDRAELMRRAMDVADAEQNE